MSGAATNETDTRSHLWSPRGAREPGEQARALMLRRALWAGVLLSPLLSLFLGRVATPIPSGVALGAGAAWAGVLVLLRQNRRVVLCGRLFCGVLFLLCLICAASLGGLRSTALAWMVAVPLCAAVLLGERETWLWCGLVGLSGLAFFAVDPKGEPWVGHGSFTSAEVALPVFAASMIALGLVATLWVRSQRQVFERALRESLEETAAETRHVGLLLGLSHAVNQADDFAVASEGVLANLADAFALEHAAVWDLGRGKEAKLVAAYPAGASPARPASPQVPSLEVAEDGTATVVHTIRSGGERYGLIQVCVTRDGKDWLPALLENVASQLATVWLKDQRSRALARQAYLDDLTDLPNRRSFHQVLNSALERARLAGTRAALLYVDLDGFKRVNDSLGHEAGDQLLRHVARRIQAAIRMSDHACTHRQASTSLSRLGGDEFTVLLDEVGEAANAELVARRILESISRPIAIGERRVEVGASIGIAVYPDDGRTPDHLIRAADKSMYAAKHAGGGGFRRADQSQDATDMVEFNAMLDAAMARGELALHYQPIVEGERATPVAVEALLRWNHPEKGALSPGWFIPLVEESGRIHELGAFVIREAITWFEGVYRDLPEDFRVCVNVSPHQLEESAFVELVKELLEGASFQPSQLELEVTETVLVADAPEVVANIRALAELGVGFSLDDFGTGYSSLSLVKRIPISRIKIDRSFIAGLPDDNEDVAIVYAVLGIADALGVPVVAEGVEDEAQQMFLTIRGCHELQGFLFAKPVPPDALALGPTDEGERGSETGHR